jgi:hypothetical protein
MRNCHTIFWYRYGSEFSRKFNQTVAPFEKIEAPFGKMEAPFGKIAALFFRKVPLNFAKQVVLLQTVAFMLVCRTVMRSNSGAFMQDGVCAFLNDNLCSEKRMTSI